MAKDNLERMIEELRNAETFWRAPPMRPPAVTGEVSPHCLVRATTLGDVLGETRVAKKRFEDLVASDPNLRLMPGGGMRMIDRKGPAPPKIPSYVKS